MGQTFDLKQFNKYREDNRLEVKRARDRLPDSLWETYSSFANTNGGCIILGVKERDDKSWYTTGLKDAAKLKKDFWDTIHNHTKVSISLLSDKDVNDYEINGDTILVISVPKARREDKPVYINNDIWGGTYRRDWEGDYHCTRNAILAMLRDQTEDTPDLKVLNNKKIEDFDYDTVRSYRVRYDTRHEGSAWTKLSNEDFLVAIGAASDETEDGTIRPTAAGLLMFGQEFRITREFPEYFLDYREKMDPSIRWTDRIQTQSGDWSGNVFDFFTRVSAKLLLDLKRPFKTDGLYRIEETKIHESVREALANCLVNTDFFQSWSVVIEKYPDRIVLANPGTIRTGKDQMLKGGISQPRNKNMFKMFNLIGIGEHAGSGVPDIYDAWREANYEDPIVEELSTREGNPDRTIVTLPLLSKANHHVNLHQGGEKGGDDREDTIIALMRENPRISAAKISAETGMTRKQVESTIKKLRENNRIHREGPDHGGSWVVH